MVLSLPLWTKKRILRKDDSLWSFVPDASCERLMPRYGAGIVFYKETFAHVEAAPLPLFTELPRALILHPRCPSKADLVGP
jgi:hypothetical protein